LLRILFATLVLLSHAPQIADGNTSRELLSRLTHQDMTLGALGVDGFFLLSGYLIVESWRRNPEFLNFLRKRMLRMLPGYLVAVALSVLAVGWLAPGAPQFFRHLGRPLVDSVLVLSAPSTPPVFPGDFYPLANGSLWTVAFEFRCYLLVALWGICGLFRRTAVWPLFTLVLLAFWLSQWPASHIHLGRTLVALLGDPEQTVRLTAIFGIGGSFNLLRKRIGFRTEFDAIAMTVLVCAVLLRTPRLEVFVALFGGYLLFSFGRRTMPWLNWMRRVPDISYGIYLYGWPVECLWVWYRHGSPWVAFAGSAVLAFGLGWLSWHFVERPMLLLKRRATAPLPGAGRLSSEPQPAGA
jgi:peptidoglycan/LPS O-acetylase OafA/YrhL